MGVARKGAKKRTHTDPYSGGQASGKLGAPDAREPKRPSSCRWRISTSPSRHQDCRPLRRTSILWHDENLFDGASPLDNSNFVADDSPGTSEATESPQSLLMRTIHQYNQMFPPIPAPQTTSYYRENTYSYS
ncbi:hypothetical protein C8J57DRAFT_1231096 [Mycena rebaudengoi]|nr:hypothetical protein C8J57DRAFT_1231096 [Mycena rebaudengoi]